MPDEEWQTLPGAYAPPGGGLLLALADGRPAGCVALRPFPEPATAEMKRLYVLPEFRGSGAGRQLVAELIALARRRGYRRIRLDTHPATMEKAIGLYRQFDFREIASDPLPPAADLLFMALELV